MGTRWLRKLEFVRFLLLYWDLFADDLGGWQFAFVQKNRNTNTYCAFEAQRRLFYCSLFFCIVVFLVCWHIKETVFTCACSTLPVAHICSWLNYMCI